MATAILVTGGAGYIGSHTCKALGRAGFLPVTLDDLSSGHAWAVRWGPLEEGDLSDPAAVKELLARHGVEGVVHFAGFTDVRGSVEDPRSYFRNNLVQSLNLLEAMVDAGVRDVVFSSTCAVYGTPEAVPIPEDHPRDPISPYGEAKLAVERALRWFGQAYGLRYASLRYFNAAGADPEGEIGEAHRPETHLIPRAIEAALGRLPALEVFGTDYPTRDGTAVRDYVHVTDLAEAHLRALARLKERGESFALNVGTGRGHTVREVIRAVEAACGREVPVREAARRAGDPAELVADTSRAARTLGWRPAMSDLPTIAETARRWHASREGDP